MAFAYLFWVIWDPRTVRLEHSDGPLSCVFALSVLLEFIIKLYHTNTLCKYRSRFQTSRWLTPSGPNVEEAKLRLSEMTEDDSIPYAPKDDILLSMRENKGAYTHTF